ncbi:hypothetical protein B0T11DRAFT_50713 [Plectosphaerella cucumerina]|uniref:Uncharacterized protein n=1 Tax=Plectosphaerella cucumerina TaxID=40658 RepID=A0A8K0X631_9PEZI|nr:hypothetical protein B0T11DRAFT_50713 [Plectosphaerella cucumerina]
MLPPSRRLPCPCLDEPDLPSTANNWTLPDSHWLDGPDGRLSGRSFGGRWDVDVSCPSSSIPSTSKLGRNPPLQCQSTSHPTGATSTHLPRPSFLHPRTLDATELPLGPRLWLQQGETGTQPELGSSNSSCFSLDLLPPIHLSSLGPAALLLIVRPISSPFFYRVPVPAPTSTRTREILRRVSEPRPILLFSTQPALGPQPDFHWPDRCRHSFGPPSSSPSPAQPSISGPGMSV